MDDMKSFEMLMERSPILLDGAMGTNLIAAGMPMGCCAEAWMVLCEAFHNIIYEKQTVM